MVDVERRQKASSRVECLFKIDSASKAIISSAAWHMLSVHFASVACQSSRCSSGRRESCGASTQKVMCVHYLRKYGGYTRVLSAEFDP